MVPHRPVTSSGVAAVVVNYNARHHLLECLRSLRSDGVSQVVVVDNASTDGSAEAVAGFDPGVAFVQTGANLGFGAAANRGVTATTGDYVLIVNPDAVVEPGATKVLAEALDRDPGLAVVGPRVENPDGSLYPSARRFPDLRRGRRPRLPRSGQPGQPLQPPLQDARQPTASQPGEVDWVSGTCMLVRRTAFSDRGRLRRGVLHVRGGRRPVLAARPGRLARRLRARSPGRARDRRASSEQAPYRMIVAHHRSLLRFAGRDDDRLATRPAARSWPPAWPLRAGAWLCRPAGADRPGPDGRPDDCAQPAVASGRHGKGILQQEGRARRSDRRRRTRRGVVVVDLAHVPHRGRRARSGLIVFSKSEQPRPTTSPPQRGDHWHAALGIDVCGEFAAADHRPGRSRRHPHPRRRRRPHPPHVRDGRGQTGPPSASTSRP